MEMDLKFTANVKIQRPLDEVFDAVYNPKKLSGYFTTKFASAPLDQDTTVYWDFADFPTEDGKGFPVKVKESVKNEKIAIIWESHDKQADGTFDIYETTVLFEFKSLSESNTQVSITESGWKQTPAGLKSTIGNAMGWMNMASCMKAYLEYGIVLRKGFF